MATLDTNMQYSRSLPVNILPIPVVDPKAANVKNIKKKGAVKVLPTTPVSDAIERAGRIAFEALPLVSMVSPQLAFAGNFAGLSVRTLISLKNNNKFEALVITASAVSFYARPLLTAQVLHGASGVINLGKAVQELCTKQFAAAGKSLLLSAYSIVYVGVLTTANPQLIAISLVAQAVFSFARAYQFGKDSKYEAAINATIGSLTAFAAYDRRADLLVPSEKYQAAFIEFKDAVVSKANEVIATLSQIEVTNHVNTAKATLQNIKFEDVKGWVQENVNLATEFVKTSFKNTFQVIEGIEKLAVDILEFTIHSLEWGTTTCKNEGKTISLADFLEVHFNTKRSLQSAKELVSPVKYADFERRTNAALLDLMQTCVKN